MRGQIYQEFIIVFALWLVINAVLYLDYSNVMDAPNTRAVANSYRETAGTLSALADYSLLLQNAEYAVVLGGTSNVSLTGPVISAGRKYSLAGENLSSGAKTMCNFSAFANVSSGTVRFKSVSRRCYSG